VTSDLWARALIVDTDLGFLERAEALLSEQGLSVDLSSDPHQAQLLIDTQVYDLAIVDWGTPGENGLPFFASVREQLASRPCLALLRAHDPGRAVDALRFGADDVIELPIGDRVIQQKVRNALQRAREQRTRIRLLRSTEALREEGGPVGLSPVFRRVVEQVADFALEEDPVLVSGEAGTGRSLIARMLHRESRPRQPLYVFAAGSLGEVEILKLEQECAAPGSLLIEQLEEMEPKAQLMLCDRIAAMRRRGLRVIATVTLLPDGTCAGLEEGMRARFRRREIVVPPLRLRIEDVPLLATWFIERRDDVDPREGLDQDAIVLLSSLQWPGNVKQLHDVLANCLHWRPQQRLGAREIEEAFARLGIEEQLRDSGDRLRGLLQISAFEDDVLPFEVEERRILVQALRVAGGHVGEAAKLLRIGRATLYRKIKVMDIAEEEWRSPRGQR
jgi:DNA-binding NtrC family response regulator